MSIAEHYCHDDEPNYHSRPLSAQEGKLEQNSWAVCASSATVRGRFRSRRLLICSLNLIPGPARLSIPSRAAFRISSGSWRMSSQAARLPIKEPVRRDPLGRVFGLSLHTCIADSGAGHRDRGRLRCPDFGLAALCARAVCRLGLIPATITSGRARLPGRVALTLAVKGSSREASFGHPTPRLRLPCLDLLTDRFPGVLDFVGFRRFS